MNDVYRNFVKFDLSHNIIKKIFSEKKRKFVAFKMLNSSHDLFSRMTRAFI